MRDSEGSRGAREITNRGTLTAVEQNQNTYIAIKIIPVPESS
jgi:hypothetical protein